MVSLALLMSSLDATIVATALHALQHDLHASITWSGWTITGYSLGLVLMVSPASKLGDRYGRRRVFLASIVVFSVASLFCGLVDNIYLLVALRVVQAIGGAGFTPAATGIVVEHFGAARDKAVGLFGSIFSIGAMIGPILGGVFVTYWSWRGIFLVNVPIGALLIPLCLHFIPADRPPAVDNHPRLDVPGMVLLGVGLLAVMLGLTYLGETGRGWVWLGAGAFVVAALALVGFLRHIARTVSPIIAPRLIYGRGFGAVNVINIVCGGGVSGLIALIPLYATTRYGIGALSSGTLLTAQSLAVIILSSLAAFLLRRTGYHRPLYLGTVLVAIGMVGLAVAPIGLSPYLWLTVVACIIGIGVGWSNPASRNAGLQLAPELSASLAALRTTDRQVGSIATISIATAVIASSAAPGVAQAFVFGVFALVLLAVLPVIARVPEHYGSW